MAIILESLNEVNDHIYTDRERDLIRRLRVMLKDLPDETMRSLNTLVEEQRGERWSDILLLTYLQNAVADINSVPIATFYDINNFPDNWTACIVTGGLIFALIAEAIIQNGESFSYGDNGISLQINLAQGYQSMAQMLLSGYDQLKKDIKRSIRPRGVVLKSDPAPVRIRSYAPRMWVYR